MQFRSFQTRLIVFFVGLLLLTLAAAFAAVSTANTQNARRVINANLREDTAVLERLIDERMQRLLEAARVLSADYAFKQAYDTGDPGTVLSAMNNHLSRIFGADLMLLLTPEGRIIADTRPNAADERNPWPGLLLAAEEDEFGEAASIALIDGRPYQMMAVPLLTPDLEAWVFIGFMIDRAFTDDLRELILSDVSVLLSTQPETWTNIATSHSEGLGAALPAALQAAGFEPGKSVVVTLGDDDYVSQGQSLFEGEHERLAVVLQRSLTEELRPYRRLRTVLYTLFAAGILLSVSAAVFIARSVTRPVLALADQARAIEQGDYGQAAVRARRDEIGTLAQSFNFMARGLAEKERVRSLLGKVVSHAVAEELLSREIELGGEERIVTVLFSDIRGFTTLCEGVAPKDILSLLNRYLTRMTDVVERHDGVVDKYIGDALMALFGAPIQKDDAALRALRTAVGMRDALVALNREALAAGGREIVAGIGLHTGNVVVGNMGSTTRLNYTAIGDGVNLASRLEGLTKFYGVPILASAATREAAPGFLFAEVDRVRVKGRTEPVEILEPLGDPGSVGAAELERHRLFSGALAHYRRRNWSAAQQALTALEREDPGGGGSVLYRLYLDRIETLKSEPPVADWDGAYTFTQK